jgi:hypothetical protein
VGGGERDRRRRRSAARRLAGRCDRLAGDLLHQSCRSACSPILIAWRFVRESAEGELPLDWPGAISATLALGVLTWALTLWSSHGQVDASSAIGIAAGLALIGLFLWIEHHRGNRAMMPFAMFGSRAFAGLTLLTFLLYGALGGLLLLLPYVLIQAAGYSALHAGFALLPMPLGMGLASRVMGPLTVRIGPRLPLVDRPADRRRRDWPALDAGQRGCALLDLGLPRHPARSALGMSCVAAPLTTAVLASVDERHTGTASGFNSAIARTGGLIATAIAGAVIAAAGAALVTGVPPGGALVGAVGIGRALGRRCVPDARRA